MQLNLEDEKICHIFSRITDYMKYKDLASRHHDKTSYSENTGLSQQLEASTVARGTSKTIRNELRDTRLNIMACKIQKEVKEAKLWQ